MFVSLLKQDHPCDVGDGDRKRSELPQRILRGIFTEDSSRTA